MATSSILGGTTVPERHPGTGTDALGPSDSSDSGSDVAGERAMATGPDDPDNLGAVPSNTDSDTDRFGTGERASATPGARDREAGDILPDSVRNSPSDALDFDRDSEIDVDELASGDDPSAGPDPEHADDELDLDDTELTGDSATRR